jgi:hypothetical protein
VRKHIVNLLIVLFILPATLFAGTLFEEEKKTSDPYVGERGGFNSLFVNPAGAAGQSGFELSANVGGRSTSNDIKLFVGFIEAANEMGVFSGDTPDINSIADASQNLSDLYSEGVIDDALLDSLFDTTTLDPDTIDWSDPAAVEAAASSLTPAEITTIETNGSGIVDGSNAAFFAALPGSVSIDALASLKTGFIIKGFGLGVYDQAFAVGIMDPSGTIGLETVYNELGIIAGGGFNLFEGKLALGISGNYGILTRNQSPIGLDNLDQLVTGGVNYGYTWGIDLGAVWRPTPSLGVGIVFNDVVGSTQADLPYTATGGYEELFETQAYIMDSLDYEVTLDLDAGITWQPDWRFVKPKLSFDMYNVIGYARDVSDNGDDFQSAMYRSLEHMRFGANFTFFEFLKLGTQYYDHYISAGVGLDLLFIELYGEFKIGEEIFNTDSGDVPMGADLMVRIHF